MMKVCKAQIFPDSYRDAIAALLQSIILAERAGNRWEVVCSYIEIVLIKCLRQEKYDDAELGEYLYYVWQTAIDFEDGLLKCYVCENRANMKLHQGRYYDVGKDLGEAAYYLAERNGYEANNTYTRLQNVLLSQRLQW